MIRWLAPTRIRLGCVLVALALGSVALAQGGPPDPPGEVVRKVLFGQDGGGPSAGTSVKILAYDPGAQKYPWLTPGSQHAQFALSLNTLEPPAGCSGPESFAWSPVRPTDPGQAVNEGLLIVDEPGHAATATGHAYGPGVYAVSCEVVFRRDSDHSEVKVPYTGDCAVIGGPIEIQVHVPSLALATWPHDENDDANPWYIQYFGYSHWSPPPLLGNKIQKTQDATVSVSNQPDGTALEWVVPWPLDSVVLSYFPDCSGFDVFAEAPSGPVEIVCFFDLTFTGMHGDVASNSGEDDTPTTPLTPGIMKTSKISAHAPADTQLAPLPEQPTPIVPPPGGAACGVLQHYIWLFDNLGQRMPMVWVQERIDLPWPPGFNANGNLKQWTSQTHLDPAADIAGRFGLDSFWYIWLGGPPFPSYLLSQRYFGGTKHTQPGEPGVYAGKWEISFVPGPPGVASHTKKAP